jgi:hypothetical protein
VHTYIHTTQTDSIAKTTLSHSRNSERMNPSKSRNLIFLIAIMCHVYHICEKQTIRSGKREKYREKRNKVGEVVRDITFGGDKLYLRFRGFPGSARSSFW